MLLIIEIQINFVNLFMTATRSFSRFSNSCQKLIYVLFYNSQHLSPLVPRLPSINLKMTNYRTIEIFNVHFITLSHSAEAEKKGKCFYAHCIFIRDNHALSGQSPDERLSGSAYSPVTCHALRIRCVCVI